MDTLLRLPEVMKRTGLGRTSVYHFMAKGKFPKERQDFDTTVCMAGIAVNQWIADRIASAQVQPEMSR
jgi:prophage regulatory protein